MSFVFSKVVFCHVVSYNCKVVIFVAHFQERSNLWVIDRWQFKNILFKAWAWRLQGLDSEQESGYHDCRLVLQQLRIDILLLSSLEINGVHELEYSMGFILLFFRKQKPFIVDRSTL